MSDLILKHLLALGQHHAGAFNPIGKACYFTNNYTILVKKLKAIKFSRIGSSCEGHAAPSLL